ncbi:hypothetical protein PFISCL1PPCAC_10459, partial [Pristionchus fissidentatus]
AAAAAAAGMGRGMIMNGGAAPMQRGPQMQRQPGMMGHPNMQQGPPGAMMNRGMMPPQSFEQQQFMQQREFMSASGAYSGMGQQMGARPQGQQNQYPGGAAGGGQMMMANQQMMIGDPQQAAMNHAHMQQMRQQGMMPNGMGRPGGPPGHPGVMQQQQQPQQQQGAGPQPGASAPAQLGGVPPINPGAQDPEKRKLIQQQLVLLLHAHKCQQRERHQDGAARNQCTLPHCSTMKEVLQHMTTCNNGRQCGYAHCASSRQIIHHWKNCQREDCPVCRPLKNIQASTPGQGGNRMSDLGDVGGLLLPSHPMPPLGGLPPTGPIPSNNIGGPPMQAQPQQQPLPQRPPINSMNMPMDFGSPGPVPVMPVPGRAGMHLLNDYTPNEMRSPNGGHRGNGMGGGREISNWPPPEQPSTSKIWHADVTNDLRHHLVGKLVKAIFPSPDPAAMHDQRIKDLIQYARKVEKDMFENADDREEYYHLLAEKIYKIQKELQEKKQKRLNESRGGNGGTPIYDMGSMPGSSNAVKSEMPASWADSLEGVGGGAGPSTSGEQMQQIQQQQIMNGVKIKKEEVDDTPSSANGSMVSGGGGGWNGSIVKEEPAASTVSSTTLMNAQPSTSAAAPTGGTTTPKKEPKGEPTPSLPPGSECVFEQSELIKHIEPVLHTIDNSDDAVPFKVPVDPIALNIPDYLEIVKEPMDLSTMAEKLKTGRYTNPWQFCDDMWLMLDNAWLYNRKNSKVYKYSTKLSELFVELINPAMQNMGYCCGQKLSFTPLALFCYGASMCTIGRDQTYFCYETASNSYGVVVSERYTYCPKCYESLPDEGISLSENPNDKTNMVPKSAFKMFKNNVIEVEPYENCKHCHRKWHKICALHDKKVYPEGFVCPSCRRDKNIPMPENKFLAKKLPHCKLSTHLEDRVNGYIKGRMPKGGDDHEVVIRVLSVVEKEVEVKPMMKNKYCGEAPGAFPSKFPYKTKAIFAFEVIDGVEVCFFGLHVQEYGSKCPAPNARRVYIAYLDSVHFFQPRQLRTDVYHEILLGYLDYVKQLGYTMAHIWACPPSEGDDYIFHCHPTEQKIPKPKRLQDWYKKMLDKGVQEQCVVEYKDIYKQARDDGVTSPADLPYFEGDFWPNVIEDCIREAGNEEANRKKEENDDDGEEEDLFTAGGSGDNGKKKGSKSKKNNLKKSSNKSKKKAGGMTGNEITDKLYSQLEKHKEVFFTIRLVTQQSALSLTADIEDPDGLMSSELMDGRDTFLTRAREEHWEFSSLRRAKYSSLCLAHALHDQEGKGMEYTCNKCNSNNAHWHCNTCDDFDLCDNCKSLVQHDHPLEKVKTILDETGGSGGDTGASNRYESIQRCIHSLVHACTCRDANCRRMSCHKMKRVVAHTKMCKKRVNASCPVCKQLIALCCYHAKHCTKEGCQVPFCMNIRQKLQEQKRSLARRADMMMRRRMEGLSAVANANTAGPSGSNPSSQPTSNPNPPSVGAAPSSSGGPPSASSLSAHNMKGGGSGSSGMHSMPTSSLSSLSHHHPSPIDHSNSKFGGQALPQSTYPPGMAAASGQSTQPPPSTHMQGGGMGVMGAQTAQYPMGMGGHPQMGGGAPPHMMGGGGGAGGGKPANPAAMMRPGMGGDGMGGYRGVSGQSGGPQYGNMGGGGM